ncbi:mannose-6-phosphate isomerase [Coprinopsis cinerea AmutBmut pab1-1]|nr:mannose-6-phosphate isomerase [Coprinopsis cinerea AmutBmut pab1-1]
MPNDAHVFKIIPTIQQYDWGKRGNDAKVAQLAAASKIPGFEVEKDKPYAELWMGTHPSSPSKVKETGEVLSEYLARNQHLVGSSITSKFEDAGRGNLPFLFKILSIAKALSIQSHPDKETAKKLHEQSPQIYKDPNHKPEMTLALTDFEAMCGFRPLPDIARNLKETPELAALIPPSTLESFYAVSSKPHSDESKAILKDLFSSLMTTPAEKFVPAIQSIVSRYNSSPESSPIPATLRSLVLRLSSQFPDDIGILCPYILNHLYLKPGQAIFLGAGEPHAYVYGEALECMANSDNVIRAGLTPKLRDVPNLVAGLTYECGEVSRHEIQPATFEKDKASVLYDPPIEEFSVVKVDLKKGDEEKQRAVDGPSIAIVTSGGGKFEWSEDRGGQKSLDVSLGDVVFIGAATPVSFSATGEDGLTLYRALVEA